MDVAIWAAVIAAIGGIIVALIQKYGRGGSAASSPTVEASLDRVKGGIDKPIQNQVVARTCRCSGWAREVGPGIYLWLAVEVNGLIWPKEGEIHLDRNKRWETTIFEDGATDQFSLSLLAANEDAHNQILDWFQTGFGTGAYAELRRIAGTRRIDRVDGLRLEKQI